MSWDDDDSSRDRTAFSFKFDSRDDKQRRIPILPVLLITFGVAALLHEMVGHGVSVFPLAIGLYLIARSNNGGHYPLYVVGAVLAGSGAGHLVGDIVGGGTADAIGTVGTAAGFFWLANTDRGRSNWALIPATILGLIAVGQFGFHVNDFAHGGAGSWMLPAGVVVAGILLLTAHRMPGPLRLAGIVFVGAAALSLVANNNDGPRHQKFIPAHSATTSAPRSFDLGDRELWVETVSGSVIVREGSGTVVRGRVSSSDSRVTITPNGPGDSVDVSVPAGARLHLKSVNGSLQVLVPTSYVDAQTVSGAITISSVIGDPLIAAAAANGQIQIDGEPQNNPLIRGGATDGRLTLRTTNGAVVLTRAKAEVAR